MFILLFIIVILSAITLYSILPNLFTRVLHVGAVSRSTSGDRRVALTFDDGPNERYTPELLDALYEANLKATFFVIGEHAMQHPEIVHRMKREGHDVQIHGYTHALVPALLPRATWKQVMKCKDLLSQQFGLSANLYRPTWGLCNLFTLLTQKKGFFRLVTWSIMVGDWRITPPNALVQEIVRQLHPGAVIVLHDCDRTWGAQPGAPQSVVQAIPKLVDTVSSQGYDFVTMTELLMEANVDV